MIPSVPRPCFSSRSSSFLHSSSRSLSFFFSLGKGKRDDMSLLRSSTQTSVTRSDGGLTPLCGDRQPPNTCSATPPFPYTAPQRIDPALPYRCRSDLYVDVSSSNRLLFISMKAFSTLYTKATMALAGRQETELKLLQRLSGASHGFDWMQGVRAGRDPPPVARSPVAISTAFQPMKYKSGYVKVIIHTHLQEFSTFTGSERKSITLASISNSEYNIKYAFL